MTRLREVVVQAWKRFLRQLPEPVPLESSGSTFSSFLYKPAGSFLCFSTAGPVLGKFGKICFRVRCCGEIPAYNNSEKSDAFSYAVVSLRECFDQNGRQSVLIQNWNKKRNGEGKTMEKRNHTSDNRNAAKKFSTKEVTLLADDALDFVNGGQSYSEVEYQFHDGYYDVEVTISQEGNRPYLSVIDY